MARVLRLPERGALLVCTDLQGCLRDFHRVVDLFEHELESTGDAHLLFTGDLIHGPHLEPEQWPVFLGEYYRDQSGELMGELLRLRRTHPGRIHALLGNHEHGHIGGPHTAKFAVDEVAVLERRLGPRAAEELRHLVRSFALVAVARCGAVFTHGAPAAVIESDADIEATHLDGYDHDRPIDILQTPVLGPLLWARSAAPEVAAGFVRALGGRFCIYGHDVIPEGFERIGDEQMVVSTSFGVFDARKVYVRLDLAADYHSVRDLELGRELRPLYPASARSAASPS